MMEERACIGEISCIAESYSVSAVLVLMVDSWLLIGDIAINVSNIWLGCWMLVGECEQYCLYFGD